MNTQTPKILTSLCAIIIIGSTANFAQAANSKDKETKELQLFSQASISLQDATKAAEHKTGGKAMEAEINDESATVQFEIEILKDGKVHEVMVDGKSGKVLKVSLENEAKEASENEKD